MTKTIFCARLKQEAEAMDKAPFPGPQGERLLQNISRQAWNMWLSHQTMLINEYRLSLTDPKAREFLATERENYLFGDGSTAPAGFTPVAKDQG
ncbi:oxidative damage protection protein [Legionella sp. CNM-4043-24]|uniref:oxidative damage protection protein n=1 Tax=Legionella sp. CNM-4043-24 TaxID=3421646 RepID=UPI00403AC789